MKKELLRAVQAAAQEEQARVVMLFGHGQHFCSGVDLKDMAANGWEHSPEGWGSHFDELIAISRAIWNLDIPVVAVVRGFALGGGLDLALIADYVLAGQSARLGAPEIMMGAFASTLIVSWLGGMKKGREILAMGVEVSAVEARELGLINRVFPDDQLGAEAEKWAAHICNIPRHAARMSKKAINMQYEMMGFWNSIALHREMSVTLNLHYDKAERAEALRFIREEGLKALLDQMNSKMLVK